MGHFPPRIPTLVPPWVHSPLAQASGNSFSTQAERGTPILLKSIHTAYNMNIQSHFKLSICFYSGFCGYVIILCGIFIIQCRIKKKTHNFTSRVLQNQQQKHFWKYSRLQKKLHFSFIPQGGGGGHRSLRSCDTKSMCKVDKNKLLFQFLFFKKHWDSPLF